MTKKRRKIVIYSTLALLLLVILIHAVNALTFGCSMQYVETSFRSPKIGPALDGYVIALVTDTHEISAKALENMAARLDQRQVDLLLLGGDYARGDGYRQTMEILGKTATVDGIFGVDGNHDDAWPVFAAMREHDIVPLDNEGLELRPGLYLAGVADLWNRRPDVPTAVAEAQPGDFVLLLSHNPDVSMRQNTGGVDVMLCGHTHGGIIAFFGVWAPALFMITDYGHKFMGGWTDAPHNTAVFVSKGVGHHKAGKLPFYLPRVFARPQVIFLTLKSE